MLSLKPTETGRDLIPAQTLALMNQLARIGWMTKHWRLDSRSYMPSMPEVLVHPSPTTKETGVGGNFGDQMRREVTGLTLMNDHESRVDHHAWVVMPNHVHVLFTPRFPLDKLMRTWKGVSARRIGRGSIWQRNYRDTLIRDHDHFVNAVRYIRRNPRGLKSGSFTLWQGERAMKVA